MTSTTEQPTWPYVARYVDTAHVAIVIDLRDASVRGEAHMNLPDAQAEADSLNALAVKVEQQDEAQRALPAAQAVRYDMPAQYPGWAVLSGDQVLAAGHATDADAWIAAAAAVGAMHAEPGFRTDAVRACFQDAYGDLHLDDENLEPLWEMAAPSVDLVADDLPLDMQVREIATRVAAAVAVLAYGVEALQERIGLLPNSPVDDAEAAAVQRGTGAVA